MMPTSSPVRTGTGAVTADSMTINTTNYPFALGFNPDSRVGGIVASWEASGTVTPTDWLDLQVLIWDGLRAVPGWVEGETKLGVRQHELVEFAVHGASMVCIRVVAVSCASGTDLLIRAAQAASTS